MIANDFQKITELLRALFTFDGDELKVKTTGAEFTAVSSGATQRSWAH